VPESAAGIRPWGMDSTRQAVLFRECEFYALATDMALQFYGGPVTLN
jgi:hypothetical protein